MTSKPANPLGTRATMLFGSDRATVYSLPALARSGIASLDRLPFSIRILLENALRFAGRGIVTEAHVEALARWSPKSKSSEEFPFMPARVVLQDFTGVPCVVDLAAMRDAMARMQGDPDRINPVVPSDLVIDHSVQVDYFGSDRAYALNVE
ncbi:MAG: aconitase family protein, partial [Gemmatimonadales bacterium]